MECDLKTLSLNKPFRPQLASGHGVYHSNKTANYKSREVKETEQVAEHQRWTEQLIHMLQGLWLQEPKHLNTVVQSVDPLGHWGSLCRGELIKYFNPSPDHFLLLWMNHTLSPSTRLGYQGLEQRPVFHVRPHKCHIKGELFLPATWLFACTNWPQLGQLSSWPDHFTG